MSFEICLEIMTSYLSDWEQRAQCSTWVSSAPSLPRATGKQIGQSAQKDKSAAASQTRN